MYLSQVSEEGDEEIDETGWRICMGAQSAGTDGECLKG